jgi:hypothetical protein
MPLANGCTQLEAVYPHSILSKDGNIAGGYYTTESTKRNICTSGVNETQVIALGTQEPQEP